MRNKKFLVGMLLLLAIIVSSCTINVSQNGVSSGTPSAGGSSGSPSNGSTTSGEPNWGVQSKSSGCVAQGGLPDSACTPGAIFTNATKDTICQSGYTHTVRNVSVATKDQVYQEYGIASHYAGQYEVDHLVPLEVGGSNDIANLWPEAASPTPGFHQKDQVENYLHDQVCSGAMDLKQAQIKVATNWLDVYNHMS